MGTEATLQAVTAQKSRGSPTARQSELHRCLTPDQRDGGLTRGLTHYLRLIIILNSPPQGEEHKCMNPVCLLKAPGPPEASCVHEDTAPLSKYSS